MLLLTGGTGFIGREVLHILTRDKVPVRLLLRPQTSTPNLPQGKKIEAAIASLREPRGVRAALVGIERIIHLASCESYGNEQALDEIDVDGTRILLEAAADASVKRIISLSHLGADRSSAFPVLRGKALAEDHIQTGGVPYTILRAALTYGPRDHFSTVFFRMSRILPFLFPIPGEGDIVLQPLWVKDLATCIVWSLEQTDLMNQTINIGGPELLSTWTIAEMVLRASQRRRRVISVQPPLYRIWVSFFRQILRKPPIPKFFADYFAFSRTAGIDSIPQYFGLQPGRMEHKINYLNKML